jgi:thiazole/oxazole-forming peptide maturase SagC family component
MVSRKNYALSQDARIFYNGREEIRIRKGIWNYTEATLNLAEQDERLKGAIIKLFEDLNNGITIGSGSVDDLSSLSNEQKEKILEIMEALKHQSYLITAEEAQVQKTISLLFGGLYQQTESAPFQPSPALIITDSPNSQRIARQIALDMKYPVDFLDEKTLSELSIADLTTNTDAIETIRNLERFGKILEPFSIIIGCFERPSISMLRNLNRLVVKAERSLVLSMIDGPFITFMTLHPPQTACFECYENRLMARMENLAVYQNFVSSTRTTSKEIQASVLNPLLYALIGIALTEGFLLSTISSAKSTGRVINVYLPIGEIQVQDLLRVPYCPACGFTAKSEMKELFTSSRMIVNKLLDTIEPIDARK